MAGQSTATGSVVAYPVPEVVVTVMDIDEPSHPAAATQSAVMRSVPVVPVGQSAAGQHVPPST